MKPTVLIIEDSKKLSEIFKEALCANFDILTALNLKDADYLLGLKKIHGILLDLQLPDGCGLEIIEKAKKINPNCVIIVVTAYGTISSAVEAMRLGAYDYLEKPVDLNELLEKFEKRIKAIYYCGDEKCDVDIQIPVSKSPSMKEIIKISKQVAKTNFPVLILGESGVGKEVIANFIHRHSERKLFLPFNCANLPYELAESLLFGHIKGAFTGANETKIGLVESAKDGTLFLDEIGDLPLNLQPKLLRFLDSGAFIPVGAVTEKYSNARIIAATNKNLQIAVKEQKFRGDLFHRLNNFLIVIPPLRERKEDILPLIQYHLKRLSASMERQISISNEAIKLLEDYDYPGNIRELFSILDKASVFCEDSIIEKRDILRILDGSMALVTNNNSPNYSPKYNENGKEKEGILSYKSELNLREKEIILNTLKECKYNKTEVAKKLGISYKTLFNKMKKLGIE